MLDPDKYHQEPSLCHHDGSTHTPKGDSNHTKSKANEPSATPIKMFFSLLKAGKLKASWKKAKGKLKASERQAKNKLK